MCTSSAWCLFRQNLAQSLSCWILASLSSSVTSTSLLRATASLESTSGTWVEVEEQEVEAHLAL